MKNKQEEQRKAREQHRQDMRTAKTRLQTQSRPGLDLQPRVGEIQQDKPTILIVCGAENTEKSYFEKFRLTSARVQIAKNAVDPISLVNYANRLRSQNNAEQVWCIFDKDNIPGIDFDKAIREAKAFGMQVGYSVQAFEYWLILHLENHLGDPLSRADYDARLNRFLKPLGTSYDGRASKIISERFFDILQANDPKKGKSYQQIAIERAKKIHNRCKHKNPSLAESCTTVYELVEELMKHIQINSAPITK